MDILAEIADVVTDPTSIAIVIAGFLSPGVTALVNQPRWSSQVRTWIGLGISLLTGLIALTVVGGWSGNWWVPLFACVGVCQTAYGLVYKPTNLADKIEDATSPTPPVRDTATHD